MNRGAAVLCGVALLCTSCATVVMKPVRPQVESPKSEIHSKGLEIQGYVTNDGRLQKFKGRVVQRGDSLEFWSMSKGVTNPEVVLPTNRVTTLFSNKTDAPRVATTALITVVALSLLTWLAFALIGAAMY